MNKLEKMRAESSGELERTDIEVPAIEESEKQERKFFSLFTFWKKLKKEGKEEEIVEVDEGEKKGVLRFFNARTAVLAASLLIIAVAGYINIRFSAVPEEANNLINGVSADALSPENTEELNVSSNESEDYFALSVINRERVRDEAIEMLLDLTNSDAVDAVAKADAYTEMTRMANEITNEANIESLVKAKGFNNCVAVVSGEDVNVVVESEGLTINQVAQIKEIVYLECGVHPDNIKIIEKAGV